jgi:hypothetical protein
MNLRPFYGLLLGPVACGVGCGAPQARVKALEEQVQRLSAAVESGAQGLGPLDDRVTAVEGQNKLALEKVQTALTELENHVARLSPGMGTPLTPGASATMWADLDDVLGKTPQGVKVTGDLYVVDLKWLSRALSQLAAVPSIKFVENKKGGGLTVRAIKPGSLPDALGIKNGDVIVAVDDQAVDTVADLQKTLHSLNSLAKVKLNRKKKDLVLEYQLAK